ncbi:MAG: hypothetical protein AB7U20_03045 [Planctomycetaceae bacterium]
MAKTSLVGDVINYRGLVYGPVNEMGVVALFAKVGKELGFIIEEVRAAFPDCIARQRCGKGWERVRIEFEFLSSNFRTHGHESADCDYIVCWEHDWVEAPIPVVSLKDFVANAQARVTGPIERMHISQPIEIRTTSATPGGIKNGYINIKPIDEFWPEECCGGNIEPARRHLIVELEGVGRVTTDISGRHKTFRSTHSEVKAFFRRHAIKPGHVIEIMRLSQFEYRVRPKRAGDV